MNEILQIFVRYCYSLDARSLRSLAGYELTPVFQSPIDGTLVYPLRNLTWMTTTMIQLFLIWAPSKNRVWQLICAVVMCNIMLGAGMMTSLVSSTSAQYSWLGVSLAGFCGTMFLQWRMVDSLVEINKDLPSSQASLRRLQKLLPLLWSVFAAVHIMCIVGLLDDETSARFMIVADVATKCAISLVVSQGIITTGNYQLEKVTHSLGISLGEFDRRKNEMLATTTHELRTPINGIIGLTDAMIHSQKILDPKVDANLRIIRDTGRRLDKLIGCIMDSAMMMESKLYLVLEEVSRSLPSTFDLRAPNGWDSS